MSNVVDIEELKIQRYFKKSKFYPISIEDENFIYPCNQPYIEYVTGFFGEIHLHCICEDDSEFVCTIDVYHITDRHIYEASAPIKNISNNEEKKK